MRQDITLDERGGILLNRETLAEHDLTSDAVHSSAHEDLPIGHFIFFHATGANYVTIFNCFDNDFKDTEGDFFVSKDSSVLKEIYSIDHELYKEIMHAPWTLKEIGPLLLQLGLPVVLSRLSTVIDQFAATKFLADAESDHPGSLAASNLILTGVMVLEFFPTTIVYPIEIMVTGANVSGDVASVALYHETGYLAALCFMCLMMPIMYFTKDLLLASGITHDTAALVGDFMHGFMWGYPFKQLFTSDQRFLYGIERPMPVLLTSLVGVLISLIMGYALVGGHWKSKAEGAYGLGIAFSGESISRFILFHCYRLMSKHFSEYPLLHMKERLSAHWEKLKEVFAEGFPMLLQMGVEAINIFMFAHFVSSYTNEASSAALQITLNYMNLELLIIFSLGQANSILIQRAHSTRLFDSMKNLARIALINAGLIGVSFGVVYASIPRTLGSWMLTAAADDDSDDILERVSSAMITLSVAQLFDSMANTQMDVLLGVFDIWWCCFARLLLYVIPFLVFAPMLLEETGTLESVCLLYAGLMFLSVLPISYRCSQLYASPQEFSPLTSEALGNKLSACRDTLFCGTAADQNDMERSFFRDGVEALPTSTA